MNGVLGKFPSDAPDVIEAELALLPGFPRSIERGLAVFGDLLALGAVFRAGVFGPLIEVQAGPIPELVKALRNLILACDGGNGDVCETRKGTRQGQRTPFEIGPEVAQHASVLVGIDSGLSPVTSSEALVVLLPFRSGGRSWGLIGRRYSVFQIPISKALVGKLPFRAGLRLVLLVLRNCCHWGCAPFRSFSSDDPCRRTARHPWGRSARPSRSWRDVARRS